MKKSTYYYYYYCDIVNYIHVIYIYFFNKIVYIVIHCFFYSIQNLSNLTHIYSYKKFFSVFKIFTSAKNQIQSHFGLEGTI